MSPLPASIKGLDEKLPRKSGDTIIPIIVQRGIFKHSQVDNSVVRGPIGSQFKLVQQRSYLNLPRIFPKSLN